MRLIDVSHRQYEAAMFKLSQGLEEDGETFVERMNSNPAFVHRVVRFIRKNGFEVATEMNRAEKIMGTNFFAPADAVRYLGVTFTRQELKYLFSRVPFSVQVLSACKNTHVLAAVHSLSVQQMCENLRSRNQYVFHPNQSRLDYTFMSKKGVVDWMLIRKMPVKDSYKKNWLQQKLLLSKDEEVPTVQGAIYTMVGHFLKTGERMFKDTLARCADTLDGDKECHAALGYPEKGIQIITVARDGYVGKDVGLANIKI